MIIKLSKQVYKIIVGPNQPQKKTTKMQKERKKILKG